MHCIRTWSVWQQWTCKCMNQDVKAIDWLRFAILWSPVSSIQNNVCNTTQAWDTRLWLFLETSCLEPTSGQKAIVDVICMYLAEKLQTVCGYRCGINIKTFSFFPACCGKSRHYCLLYAVKIQACILFFPFIIMHESHKQRNMDQRDWLWWQINQFH